MPFLSRISDAVSAVSLPARIFFGDQDAHPNTDRIRPVLNAFLRHSNRQTVPTFVPKSLMPS